VAAGLDMKAMDQRVTGGVGLPGNQLLQSSFAYYPNDPGPTYDPVKAKQLVAEAKAAGWDGKIRYTCSNQPQEATRALAIQAMLKTVGIDVVIQSTDATTYVQSVVVSRDFDLACWGMSIFNDDRGYTSAMLGNFSSTSPRTGYSNPEMDAAITALKTAATADEKRAAYKTISALYDRDLPALTFTAQESFYAWNNKVHGIYSNLAFMMYFDKTWLST
jgi:peptide/nickel transport system substrate-binding protein